MTSPRPSRSDRLLKALAGYERILVVMHDNPDPDAIAAGWAVLRLIRERLGITARLLGGGDIVRAENRHLVKLLRPPLELVTDVEVRDTTAGILVDCGFTAANHLLAKGSVRPVAVIDHHAPNGAGRERLPFRDVRPGVAAAASIAASYLREQSVEPAVRLATALAYGIRTETRGSQVKHSRLDRSILRWLARFVNPEWIAEIENAPLPRAYFTDLARALDCTRVFGESALCLLPEASGAEIVGEVADLLIRYESVGAVMCVARVGADVVVSVRTERGGADAAVLVRAALDGLGGGGGHAQRAGGKIPGARLADRSPASLERELTKRWREICGVGGQRGVPLVLPLG